MTEGEFRALVTELAGRADAHTALAGRMLQDYESVDRRCCIYDSECGHTAVVARHGRNILALLSGQDNLQSEELALMHTAAASLQTLRKRMRYQHRLRCPRRTFYEGHCGAYPFRDAGHDVVRVSDMAPTSKPAASGRRYAGISVEPFVHPGLSQRRRAALYESRLIVRRLTRSDLQSNLESTLIRQQGVFATRAIPAGTCLGVYGGRLMRGPEWMLLTDDRYLITLNGEPPVHLDGENLLSLANTIYLLDPKGEIMGHPEAGYNCEMAGFPTTFAYGWKADLPALFATRDLAPGEELRWNYATVRVRGNYPP